LEKAKELLGNVAPTMPFYGKFSKLSVDKEDPFAETHKHATVLNAFANGIRDKILKESHKLLK
jgi:hypothetical protein